MDAQTPIFDDTIVQKPIFMQLDFFFFFFFFFFNNLLRKTQIRLGGCWCLIRVFAVRSMVAKGSVLLQADSEDSDQTGRMRRLIC